jgi:hypothetical protein
LVNHADVLFAFFVSVKNCRIGGLRQLSRLRSPIRFPTTARLVGYDCQQGTQLGV